MSDLSSGKRPVRLGIAVFVAVLSFLVAACGSTNSGSSGSGASPAASASSGSGY